MSDLTQAQLDAIFNEACDAINAANPVTGGGQTFDKARANLQADNRTAIDDAAKAGASAKQISDAISAMIRETGWTEATGENFPNALSHALPQQVDTATTAPIPAAPDAPNVSIGASRDSTEILRRLNLVPPVRPDGYVFCNATDWNAIWKARVVAKLAQATNPGAYLGVDSGTVRLAATYEAFDFGTSIRGRASNAFSGPFTAAEIQGMSPGQFAEHVEPKGAGPARVV